MWKSGWEGGLEENGYLYMHGWVPLLVTWNNHSIVNQLFVCSVAKSCLTFTTSWTIACKASLSFTISHNLLKLKTTDPVMPSNRVILCCFLLLLPSIFPSIKVFPVSRLSISGGQSIGSSASASVLPMNIQDWFPLELTDLISLLSKGLKRVFSGTTIWKHQFFGAQPSLWSNSHIHTWLLEKP